MDAPFRIPWLLRSKLAPPRTSLALISRQRLTSVLESLPPGSITVIKASAGYGKTSLMSQWYDAGMAAGHVCAWLSLDEQDRSPNRFVQELAFALHFAGIDLMDLGLLDAAGPVQPDPSLALAGMLDRIADDGRPTLLCLDNFEEVHGTGVRQLLNEVVALIPANLQITLATRTNPSLSLARLRSAGLVREIAQEELRFTAEEIEQNLAPHLGRREIEWISRHAEGWPVIMQLIRHRLESGCGSEAAGTLELDVSQSLEDYVHEQIISTLADADARVLLSTAFLTRIWPELADHITGRADCGERLRILEKTHFLVTSVRNPHPVYKLHPVLRQILLKSAQLDATINLRILHRRAAEWFAQQEDLLSAVTHYVESDRPAEAINVIGQCGGVLVAFKHGIHAFRELLDVIPERYKNESIHGNVMEIFLMLKDGHIREARRAFHTLSRLTAGFTSFGGSQPGDNLLFDIGLAGAFLDLNRGPVADLSGKWFFDAADSARLNTAAHTDAIVSLIHSYSHHQYGDLSAAAHTAEHACRLSRKLRWRYNDLFVGLQQALILQSRGQLTAARAGYEKILGEVSSKYPGDVGLATHVRVLLAETLWELDESGKCTACIPQGLQSIEHAFCWYDIRASFYSMLLRLAGVNGDIANARLEFDRLDAFIRSQNLGNLSLLVAAGFLNLLLLWDREDAAGAFLDDHREILEADCSGLTWREQDALHMTRARLHLSRGEYPHAIDELDWMVHSASLQERVLSQMRARALRCVVRYRAKGLEAAMGDLFEVLDYCNAGAAWRLVADEAAALRPVLEQAASAPASLAVSDRNRGLCSIALTRVLRDRGPDGEDCGFTKRELDVLWSLGRGEANKVIARRLRISESTVKFHVKNVFRKLEVTRRSEALQEARRRQLIP